MDSVKPQLISFKICPLSSVRSLRSAPAAYRDALLARPSVADSVVPEFTELFIEYFRGQGGHVAGHLPAPTAATRKPTHHLSERISNYASEQRTRRTRS